MNKKLVNILSISLIYCGSVFGAGFASGREIFTFFSCYKMSGVVASIFAGFLFLFFGFWICRYSKIKQLENSEQFFQKLFPKKIAKLLTFFANLFLVLSFCIMITGCGTLFYEQFGIPVVVASTVSLLICFLVIKSEVGGLEKFNFWVTPFMLVGIILLCGLCIFLPKVNEVTPETHVKPLFSGVLYVSYNMVSAVAVLVSAAKIAKTPKEAALGGALGGFLTMVPLVLMSLVLAQHWEVSSFPMPFFRLIYENFSYFSFVCSGVMYFAMMTTAVASGVGVMANIKKSNSTKYAILLCLLAFLISFLPFGELVVSVYSSFGVIGVVLILGISFKIFRK